MKRKITESSSSGKRGNRRQTEKGAAFWTVRHKKTRVYCDEREREEPRNVGEWGRDGDRNFGKGILVLHLRAWNKRKCHLPDLLVVTELLDTSLQSKTVVTGSSSGRNAKWFLLWQNYSGYWQKFCFCFSVLSWNCLMFHRRQKWPVGSISWAFQFLYKATHEFRMRLM